MRKLRFSLFLMIGSLTVAMAHATHLPAPCIKFSGTVWDPNKPPCEFELHGEYRRWPHCCPPRNFDVLDGMCRSRRFDPRCAPSDHFW